MRVFIAIELDNGLKEYVFEKQQIVNGNSIKGNFSRKENFHLTLRFIGEIREDKIGYLKECIDKTSEDFSSFKLRLGKLGCFQRKNRKIIWLGIDKGQKKLQQLFNILENNLERKGFGREARGLNPHITLARQVILNEDFQNLSQRVKIEKKEINVDAISLMESRRIDGKLRYVPLYTKNIKASVSI